MQKRIGWIDRFKRKFFKCCFSMDGDKVSGPDGFTIALFSVLLGYSEGG
jgi:hypothetical protein